MGKENEDTKSMPSVRGYVIRGEVGERDEKGRVEVDFEHRYIFREGDQVYSIQGITVDPEWLKIYLNGEVPPIARIPSQDLNWYIEHVRKLPPGSVTTYIPKRPEKKQKAGNPLDEDIEKGLGLSGGLDALADSNSSSIEDMDPLPEN